MEANGSKQLIKRRKAEAKRKKIDAKMINVETKS